MSGESDPEGWDELGRLADEVEEKYREERFLGGLPRRIPRDVGRYIRERTGDEEAYERVRRAFRQLASGAPVPREDFVTVGEEAGFNRADSSDLAVIASMFRVERHLESEIDRRAELRDRYEYNNGLWHAINAEIGLLEKQLERCKSVLQKSIQRSWTFKFLFNDLRR